MVNFSSGSLYGFLSLCVCYKLSVRLQDASLLEGPMKGKHLQRFVEFIHLFLFIYHLFIIYLHYMSITKSY